MSEFKHIPVMLNEVIEGLAIKPDGVYADLTLGGAGHSIEILKRLTSGHLYGVDKDQDALKAAKERLKDFDNCTFINSDFKDAIKELPKLDGILMDLGVSSYQLDTAERGFSYRLEGELDMRMCQNDSLTAKDVVNTLSEQELSKIFFEYGEDKFSRQIANAICKKRIEKPIETTKDLTEIIWNSIPVKARYSGSNPYMRVFQALRIYVNGELNGLSEAVDDAVSKLKKGGRLCIITFHSLEDRIVKQRLKYHELDCICPPKMPICTCGKVSTLKIITKKPITATEDELKVNSRSECAKLRIAEKKV